MPDDEETYRFSNLHWILKILVFTSFIPTAALISLAVLVTQYNLYVGIFIFVIGIFYLLAGWVWYACGVRGWEIAHKKGRNTDLAFAWGILYGIPGFFVYWLYSHLYKEMPSHMRLNEIVDSENPKKGTEWEDIG